MSIATTTQEYYLSEIGTYENLKIKETRLGELGSNEVLVKIHAVSLQSRDIVIAKGFAPPEVSDLVPCSDMAGEVVSVGTKVTQWQVGDRVCSNFCLNHLDGEPRPDILSNVLGGPIIHGVLTQFKALPELSLVAIPEHLSYEEASTLPCAALTAYNALRGPVPVKAGDVVIVMGTGGVSTFGLQLAVASGATVIATSSSDEKLKFATELGAKHVINYKTTPDWDKEVDKITGGRGADHILEVGGGGTLVKSMNAVRTAGWIHIIGGLSSTKTPVDIVPYSIRKAIIFRGIQVGSVAQFRAMNRLIAAHPKITKPIIDKVFEWEEAIEAYKHLERQTHVGKVVIRVAKN